MEMEIGHSWLRNRVHTQAFRLLPEIARDQSFDNIGLDFFGETLPDDRRGHMASPETWQARHLLVFLN